MRSRRTIKPVRSPVHWVPVGAAILLAVSACSARMTPDAGEPTPHAPGSATLDAPELDAEPSPSPIGTISPLLSSDPTVMDQRYREALPLFDYNATVPLRIRKQGRTQGEGTIDLSYDSPGGGRVPATLVVPAGAGPFPAVILQHGLPGDKSDVAPLARALARLGAVAMAIDAPFARPPHRDRPQGPVTFTPRDAREQIQLIVDLQRAVDLLAAREDVDPRRLAYVGISYGAAMGGLLAGVERRIRIFALAVGDGGLVTHFGGPDDEGGPLFQLPPHRREAWVAAMEPIEPLYYVGHAAPARLLFQSGTFDELVPPADAVSYHEAGSEPKEIRWYDSGHQLPQEASCDRLEWLDRHLDLAGRPDDAFC